MNELKPMICECCGGHIDRVSLTCKMCGTPYRLDEECKPIRVVQYDSKIETISGCIRLPSYMVVSNPEEAMRFSLNQLAEKMVEKMMPLLEYEQSYDHRSMEYVTYGRIRVAVPHTRGSGHLEILRGGRYE